MTVQTEQAPHFLTIAEAAEILRVHPRTIRNRVQEGLLPAKRMRGSRLVLVEERDVLGLLEDVFIKEGSSQANQSEAN